MKLIASALDVLGGGLQCREELQFMTVIGIRAECGIGGIEEEVNIICVIEVEHVIAAILGAAGQSMLACLGSKGACCSA